MARPEHLTGSILTGHFRCDGTYAHRRPAGTDDWLLFCTLGGRGRISHRFGDLLLGAGDMAAFVPGTPHDYATAASADRWEFLWLHLHPRGHWLDWLRWPAVAPGVLHLHLGSGRTRRVVQQGLAMCHRHALMGGIRGIALAQAAFELALIHCDTANPQAADAGRDRRVSAAMDYCARNLAGRFHLADVAASVGLSVYRLAHLFRADTGTTIQRFVEQLRLQRAQELLTRTAMSVQEVATEVGFDSAFYFSTRFRRATGLSPRAFRDRGGRPPRRSMGQSVRGVRPERNQSGRP